MTKTKGVSAGRPRTFDIDLALHNALIVFWRNGYEGTSLTELTQAMGINKPSLYAAFGNKEQLFLKAIDLYEERPDSLYNVAFEHDHISDVIKTLLVGAATKFTVAEHPQGCALINSTLSCSESSESIKIAMNDRKDKNQRLMIRRFEDAKTKGQLNRNSEPIVLARLIMTLFKGMSLQASEGATKEELCQVAQMTVDGIISQNVN